MRFQHVIFDLDGTLIDSSASILQSFESAFRLNNMAPIRPLTPEVIGPPLMTTLKLLSGLDDPQVLMRLAEAFKSEYDHHAYKLATVFDGVEAMLDELKQAGFKLYIATNKRILPTRKIMQHLNWTHYFEQVYALDYFNPALPNKTAMVTEILHQLALPIKQTAFVGDRVEDGEAASANQLTFAMVSWGYLDSSMGTIPKTWHQCSSPGQLLEMIKSGA